MLLAVAAGAVAYYLVRAGGCQNATRLVFGLDPFGTRHPLTIGGIAFALILSGWLLFRLLGVLFDRLAALLGRLLPLHVGLVVTFAVMVWLVWGVTDGVLMQRAFDVADLLIEPWFPQPSEPRGTGSPASLVTCEEMGRRGREFVARTPTVDAATTHLQVVVERFQLVNRQINLPSHRAARHRRRARTRTPPRCSVT